MPQAAASRTSNWPLSLPAPADYPRGAASCFSVGSPAVAVISES